MRRWPCRDRVIDLALLEMFETTISLPRDQWRPGMRLATLVEELRRGGQGAGTCHLLGPGRSAAGHRHAGHRASRARSACQGHRRATLLRRLRPMCCEQWCGGAGRSPLRERLTGGRYIDVIDRARRGAGMKDRRRAGRVAGAVGGEKRHRDRRGAGALPGQPGAYLREWRDTPQRLPSCRSSMSGQQVAGSIAKYREGDDADGPPMLQRERGGWRVGCTSTCGARPVLWWRELQ